MICTIYMEYNFFGICDSVTINVSNLYIFALRYVWKSLRYLSSSIISNSSNIVASITIAINRYFFQNNSIICILFSVFLSNKWKCSFGSRKLENWNNLWSLSAISYDTTEAKSQPPTMNLTCLKYSNTIILTPAKVIKGLENMYIFTL